jgi:hypothetical protein
MMSRRTLIGSLSLAMLQRHRAQANMVLGGLAIGPPPGLAPDGSIIIGQPGGGGDVSLNTAYGLLELGSVQAPPDGTHAGTFCMPMLNGEQMNPVGSAFAFGIPSLMRLRIDHGIGNPDPRGRIYGVDHDQIWGQWSGYHWSDNFGQAPDFDYLSGPGLDPPPQPLPTYAPPYTPSAENTSISGGTGSLTTAHGIWGFGTAGGGGWRATLNGIELQSNAVGFPTFDLMTVYGHSRMFLRRTDGSWSFWALHQENPSTGPTAAAVPINLTIAPSRPQLAPGPAPNSLVADISVTMSDGSAFTGSFTIATNNVLAPFKIVGSQILIDTTPPNDFYINKISATQNGATIQIYTIVGVG